MDFSALDTIGWRDGVLLAVGLSGVYLVLTVLRLFQVGKRAQQVDSRHDAEFAVTPASTFAGVEPMIDLSREIPAQYIASPSGTPAAPASSAMFTRTTPRVMPPEPVPGDFARELSRSSVEVEVQQLRRESAVLREELGKLRDELASLKAARNVSPLYNEAMALAQQGVPAEGISGQCGISLAEAELVAALAQGQSIDQQFETDEERNGGYSDTRTGTHG
jgi:hypothetical protein